jgi:hypothetical protein
MGEMKKPNQRIMQNMKDTLGTLGKAAVLIAVATWLGATAQAATLIVTSTDDSGAGTLRDALANAADSDTIDATGVSGAITLTNGRLSVSNSVTILGPGANILAVNGNYPNTTNGVFYISPGLTVTIAGLTLTNGAAITGGGIYNNHSELTVSNCTLTGNSALPGGGGGILNDGAGSGSATLTLIGSTVSSNTASDGGGGILSNGHLGSAVVTILDSTISGNSGSFGGAIWNAGEGSPGTAILTIYNSTISSNSAGGITGGLLNDGLSSGTATLTIGSTILAGNSIANLHNDHGTVTSLGYNLSSDNGGGFLSEPTDLPNTDPLLGPLQLNGGPDANARTVVWQPGN